MTWQPIILVLDDPAEMDAAFPEGAPWASRQAEPALATDGSAQHAREIIVTAEERAALEAAFPLRVLDGTIGGIGNGTLRFPAIAWDTLGFVAGFEIGAGA